MNVAKLEHVVNSLNWVKVADLELKSGDAVVTAKGTFLVLSRDPPHWGEVIWLETEKRITLHPGDDLFGPIEVVKGLDRPSSLLLHRMVEEQHERHR